MNPNENSTAAEERTDPVTNETEPTPAPEPNPVSEPAADEKAADRKAKKSEKKKNAELDKIKEELDAVRAELDKSKDMLLRTAAEFDNFKRRTEKEKADLSDYVKSATVKNFLSVADNIKRAADSDKDSPDYVKGLEMIIRQLSDTLDKIGLEEIDAEGKPFDPALHEAVMHVEDDAFGENTVAQVLQPGYKLGNTVLRTCMVKVAN